MKGIILACVIFCLTNISHQEECKCLYKNYNPVCGLNGVTYYSQCHMDCDNVEKASNGYCNTNDCNCPLIIEPVCGENGITYNNSCEAACHNMLIKNVGRCGPCDCSSEGLFPVCGINGVTFPNECEARCRGVRIEQVGRCGTNYSCQKCEN